MTDREAITAYHEAVTPAEHEYKRVLKLATAGDSFALLHLGEAEEVYKAVEAEANKQYHKNIGG